MEVEVEVEVVSSPGTVAVVSAVLGVVVRRWMPCERGMKIIPTVAARTGRRVVLGYPPPPVALGLD